MKNREKLNALFSVNRVGKFAENLHEPMKNKIGSFLLRTPYEVKMEMVFALLCWVSSKNPIMCTMHCSNVGLSMMANEI